MVTHPVSKAAELHQPVLLSTCVNLLSPALQSPGAIFIDCTLGMGGHTEAVLTACPAAKAYGIDRDPEALNLAGERLAPFGDRFTPIHAEYDHVGEIIENLGQLATAILFDLGVSSLQLDDLDRGFSYSRDAPLDMRMNQRQGRTAAEFLATASAGQIAQVLRDYGEEKFAHRIAQNIVSRRERQPLTRTGELADLVRDSIPVPARRKGGHPAKRTFQALRIEVNDELAILRRAIPAALDSLQPGGRLVVESYQSLEDRIVKSELRKVTQTQAPPDLPVVPVEQQARAKDLTRGAIKASPEEIEANPRAASVRLRAVEIVMGEET